MRIITWNMRRATEKSIAWKILQDFNPDIALLQEVSGIPNDIKKIFDIKFHKAINKNGGHQNFGTAIFVKGKIISDLKLYSKFDWVNSELEYFSGNLISCVVETANGLIFNVVSVYSPAWPIDTSKYVDVDVDLVKTKKSPRVWVIDILRSALKNMNLNDNTWVIGGDLNSSETFDLSWPSGSIETLDSMKTMGFSECLRKYKGKLTPTFKNVHGGKIIHQMDHLFVSNPFFKNITKCSTGDEVDIFEKSISDHLPVIADFKDTNFHTA